MTSDYLKKIFEKGNSNKKYLIVAVIGFVLIFLILLSESDFAKDDKEDLNDTKSVSAFDYSEYLEKELCDLIESIDGAGKTNVMITISETSEYVYAKNDKNANKSTDKTSDSTYDSEYVIVEQNNNDEGLLVKVIEPKIRGVAVVCEGADDPVVQQNIYSTVSAVLNISTARISISKSKAEGK